MSRVGIKVCGITRPEDGLRAAAAGADAIGIVFWPRSPRAVDVETARRIAAALPPFVVRVGVFVDAPRAVLCDVADAVGLDIVQLHGSEAPETLEGLSRRVIKALRVRSEADLETAARYAQRGATILLDAGKETSPGGTGERCDWSLARRARERVGSLVLAGGLTPENVKEAIDTVRPAAVDVSSGVESAPGRKDAARLAAFVAAVRGSEAHQGTGDR